MSAPRWTLSHTSGVLCRDGMPVLQLSAYLRTEISIDEQQDTANRIVALLNATELSSDALARLQAVVMEHACWSKEESLEVNALTDTLNHTARMYVELDEEASLELEDGEHEPKSDSSSW